MNSEKINMAQDDETQVPGTDCMACEVKMQEDGSLGVELCPVCAHAMDNPPPRGPETKMSTD
jgi:hypothetical protein